MQSKVSDNRTSEEQKSYSAGKGPQLRTVGTIFVIVAVLLAAALLLSDYLVNIGHKRMEEGDDHLVTAQNAAAELESASDFLTDRVRCFVATGDSRFLTEFYEEVETTGRRDKALADLQELFKDKESGAIGKLTEALRLSNELVNEENKAFRLVLEATGQDIDGAPETIRKTELSAEELAMTPEQQRARAAELVFSENYMEKKRQISLNTSQCVDEIIDYFGRELENSTRLQRALLTVQTVLTVVFLIGAVIAVIFVNTQVRRPLTRMVRSMRDKEKVRPEGAAELRFVSSTYNEIYDENRKRTAELTYEASHDKLTGLYNRAAYDMFMQSIDTSHIGLIIVDVDKFKSVNDTYGHDVGDRLLKKVSEVLKHSFRSVDMICRFGGDEFVVIMTRANNSMGELVKAKIDAANRILSQPEDGLPPSSLSVGVAFSDRENPGEDIFKDADTALYRIKEAGRSGCSVY